MRIAAFGDINIDVILYVEGLPGLGEEVFSSHRIEILGGSAANTAVVLTRLGHEVAVMGAVGDDSAGDLAVSYLMGAGVDTSLTIRTTERPTAMNTIMVTPDGERTMVGARGANVDYRNVSGWETGLDWLHVSGYALMNGAQQQSAVEAIETAERSGIQHSIDIPSGVGEQIREAVSKRLAGFAVIAGSRLSLSDVAGSDEPVASLLELGVSRVAMTSGPRPLILADRSGSVTVTPPHVDSVDATGAGDALIAGLISAHLAGLALGPSAVLAAAAGAAATLEAGGTETLASPDIWADLVDADRWADADPSWLDEVGSLMTPDTEQQDRR